jgi:phytoene dehydrogenase-like protein
MVKYDVAIVGGGLAGLTAAIYAAKAGKKTIVLEQQEQIGGRAITKKKNGAYFDLGGRALFKSSAVEIWKELEVEFDVKEPSLDAFGIWKGKKFTLPVGLMSLLKTSLLSFKGKLEIATWLTKLEKLDTNQLNKISLRDWIEENIQNPMARNILYTYLRSSSYVLEPELQIAGPYLKQLQNSLKGVLYPEKGWGTMVEKLQKKAIENGVSFLTGNKVVRVEHQNSQVQSVQCADGRKVVTSNVILATSPTIAHKLIPHADSTALQLWKDQAKPITAACLSVALRRLPIPKNQFIYGIDQPILFSNQSRTVYLSDNGDQVIHLVKYQGIQTDVKKDEQDLEQFLELVQPGWRNELVARQYLPKIIVTHDFMHIKRKINPGPNVPELKGLYVAGDWATHGEVLAEAAVASAKRAIEHILAAPHY